MTPPLRAGALTVLLALAVSGCAGVDDGDTTAAAPAAETYQADVLEVRSASDIVLDVEGKQRSVRLAEVRLPAPGECLGDEAQRQLRYRLRVGLGTMEVTELGTDSAGRDLVRIKSPWEDRDAATHLVADGLAVADYEETKLPDALRAARDEAVAGYHGMFNNAEDCTLYSRYDEATEALDEAAGWARQTTSAGAALLVTALVAAIETADAVEDFLQEARRDLRVLAYPPARLTSMAATLARKRQAARTRLARTRQLKRRLVADERRARARERERNAEFWRDWNATHPDTGSGGSGGYTGPRCYEPGGRVWHPC